MSVKDVIKQSWEDLKSLEFNFQNLCILAIATIITSTICLLYTSDAADERG